MKQKHFLCSAVLLVLMNTGSLVKAEGHIRWVPEDYPTIQSAINAAEPGDIVSVADGIYSGTGNINLDFHGKPIKIYSRNGNKNCIIDCQDTGRGVFFHSSEDEQSVLSGFTIRNGRGSEDGEHWYAGGGGGIYCKYSTPLIEDCIIKESEVTGTAQNWGGGISCFRAGPIIRGCAIINNLTDDCAGGIYLFESAPIIQNCQVNSNRSSLQSGGIHSRESDTSVSCCTIEANTIGPADAVIYGGGIYCLGGNLDLLDCVIDFNVVQVYGSYWGYGAGVCVDGDGMYRINNSTIAENEIHGFEGRPERSQGGGIAVLFGASASINNCLISRNSLRGDITHGAGIISDFSDTTIMNCTVADNEISETTDVGGIFVHGLENDVSITNCIVWGNSGTDLFDNMGGITVSYSNIDGTFPGTGNICMLPVFAEGVFGGYYLSQMESGESVDSPCVDTGSIPAVNLCFKAASGDICMDMLTTRTDQAPDAGIVDMGYHYPLEIPVPTTTPTHPVYPTRTPTAEPTATQPASQTQTPSSTPWPSCDTMGCKILMPSARYKPFDSCSCSVLICNTDVAPLVDVPFFIMLETGGELYDLGSVALSVPPGPVEREIFPAFSWPGDCGSGSATLYAALTDPEITRLLGEYDIFDIEWE